MPDFCQDPACDGEIEISEITAYSPAVCVKCGRTYTVHTEYWLEPDQPMPEKFPGLGLITNHTLRDNQ